MQLQSRPCLQLPVQAELFGIPFKKPNIKNNTIAQPSTRQVKKNILSPPRISPNINL